MDTIDRAIGASLSKCQREFEGILRRVTGEVPEVIAFEPLWNTWVQYYSGPFRQLDTNLLSSASRTGSLFPRYIVLSTMHHNIHRLMEVLSNNIQEKTLGDSNIPERVTDLLESFMRLAILLNDLEASRFGDGVRTNGAA